MPGIPPAQRIGWCQFNYGQGYGKLQPISFAQSMLIPEQPGAIGGIIMVPADVTWTAHAYSEPDNGFSFSSLASYTNMALGVFNGLKGAARGHFGPVDQAQASTQMPINTFPPTGQTLQDTGAGNSWMGFPVQGTNYSAWIALLAYASEIAQQACMYNQSETFEDSGTISGASLFAPTDGVPRSAAIQVGHHPVKSSYNFGSTGALMLGYYAWDYDGYKGPLHYINNVDTWTIPEAPSSTGLYVMLKPGVNANIHMGVNEFISTSMITSTGEVNLAAGITRGILAALQ